ncbi:hypothetical protein OAE72_01100 [Akkermansiaceae bacterium]|nr:hypothetical protein [Akkermansiaceae bacterium]
MGINSVKGNALLLVMFNDAIDFRGVEVSDGNSVVRKSRTLAFCPSFARGSTNLPDESFKLMAVGSPPERGASANSAAAMRALKKIWLIGE